MSGQIEERLLKLIEAGDVSLDAWTQFYADLRAFRQSFTALHRRCQRAEAALANKLRHAPPTQWGRGMMAWGYAKEKKRADALQQQLDRLTKTPAVVSS